MLFYAIFALFVHLRCWLSAVDLALRKNVPPRPPHSRRTFRATLPKKLTHRRKQIVWGRQNTADRMMRVMCVYFACARACVCVGFEFFLWEMKEASLGLILSHVNLCGAGRCLFGWWGKCFFLLCVFVAAIASFAVAYENAPLSSVWLAKIRAKYFEPNAEFGSVPRNLTTPALECVCLCVCVCGWEREMPCVRGD